MEALLQEASFQEASFQEASFQEASFQEASFQEASFQEASFQEASFQEASLAIAVSQSVGSNCEVPLSVFTNPSSARFRFGGFWTVTAAAAESSPTPPEKPADESIG